MRPTIVIACLLLVFSLLVPQTSAASNGSCSDSSFGTGSYAANCGSSFACTGAPGSHPNCYFRFILDASVGTGLVRGEIFSSAGSFSCIGIGSCSISESVVARGNTGYSLGCRATAIGTGTVEVDCEARWFAWTFDPPT